MIDSLTTCELTFVAPSGFDVFSPYEFIVDVGAQLLKLALGQSRQLFSCRRS